MIVVPTGKTLPAGTPVRSRVTTPELSLAEAVPSVPSLIKRLQLVAPGPVPSVTLAGADTSGLIVSLTVIETVAAELVSAGAEPSPVSVTVNLKLSGPL